MDISTIRARNAQAGKFFFSRDTMRFFRSQVGRTVYSGKLAENKHLHFFWTSEQFVSSTGKADRRKYTVRVYNERTHDVDTYRGADFQEFRTGRAASAECKYAAATYIPEGEKHHDPV